MSPPFTGRHVLAELCGAAPEALEDEPGLRTAFGAALTDAGATVLQILTHRFTPHGLTLVALLAQSHASLHTWPERGAAFADVFTYGPTANPERAVTGLAERLGAHLRMYTVQRGTAAPVREPLGPGLTRLWDIEQVLWEGHTPYQHVLIARTSHGVTLFCDDERQSSQATQLVYHEALLVPALALAERLDHVLVIGSGEGVASQIAVAAGAQRVDHVDIDRDCVRRCAALLGVAVAFAEDRADMRDRR